VKGEQAHNKKLDNSPWWCKHEKPASSVCSLPALWGCTIIPMWPESYCTI